MVRAPSQDDGKPLEIRRHSAKARGWVVRPDLGPNVWEAPNGDLYQGRAGHPPIILSIDLPPPPMGCLL